MTQQANPDKGFYASIPRLVRTGYNQLNATTKWIYVCLKDLCGENGTCYRTLRTLANEIGNISISTLSESIRALRQAGLILAEKQRRPDKPTAKETWHISIVNVWGQNGKTHPTQKCSPTEHFSPSNVPIENIIDSPPERNHKNVLRANNNVRPTNGNPSFRSESEQQCSQIGTKERREKHDHLEELSLKNEREIPPSSQASDSSINHSSDLFISQGGGCVSELPDSDAVMPNATEELILQSLIDLGIPKSAKTAPAHIEKLLSQGVEAKNDVVELLAIARELHPGKMIWLGNLAEDRALGEWRQTRAERATEEPPQLGLSREDCDQLCEDMLAWYEHLVLWTEEHHERWYIGVRYDDHPDAIIAIGLINDWYQMPNDLLNAMVDYGYNDLQKKLEAAKMRGNIHQDIVAI